MYQPAKSLTPSAFTHPRSGARLRFEAPPPPDLAGVIEVLEGREASP